MFRIALGLILLLTSSTTLAGNDIWQTLFREKLQEASRGNSNAQYDVGTMLQNGRGTKADRNKAIAWYQKAADQNNEKASSRLQLLKSNEARFIKEYARAEKGDVESQYTLGNMYTKGMGVNINHTQANIWYEKAARQGHVKAKYKLGLIYYEGNGVSKNLKTAFKWFKSAAENGYPAAQYYVGKMYGSGQGVRENYNASLEWYRKAVDAGFNQARGEMIDIRERLKTRKTAKSAAPGNKTVHRKAADTQPGKTIDKASYSMENLTVAAWKRDDLPVAYLPSVINSCQPEKDRIICNSHEQTRQTSGSTIKFKTRAIISKPSHEGVFNVSYRNLVIDSERLDTVDSDKDDGLGSLDEAIESTHMVKTGWGKEHNLECRMKNNATVACLKNKTHSFVLTSQQRLASGK